jgi:hypothetical protein
MIVRTMALFTSHQDSTDESEEVAKLLGETVRQNDDELIPTPFTFDMYDVISINKSSHAGYTTIRTIAGDYSVQVKWETLSRLFQICKG